MGQKNKLNENTEIRELFNMDGSRIRVLEFPALKDCGGLRAGSSVGSGFGTEHNSGNGIVHLFSTREGGVSNGIFRSMNLGFDVGDEWENVEENFRRLAAAAGITPDRIAATDQTHTTNIRVVTAEDAGKGVTHDRDYTDIDGLVTNVPGIALAVFGSDCVPLFFVDPVNKAIGASHSGWRGTVARMGSVTVEKMQTVYGTDPADLICVIGPSICRDCYEVSEDVADEFKREFCGHEEEIMSEKGGGKYLLDLWESNRIVLEEAGVLPKNITISGVCTSCCRELLFSHRATKGKRGNNCGLIMLRERD